MITIDYKPVIGRKTRALSTVYNRLDPVDFDTFTQYVNRYRRSSKHTAATHSNGYKDALVVPSPVNSLVWRYSSSCPICCGYFAARSKLLSSSEKVASDPTLMEHELSGIKSQEDTLQLSSAKMNNRITLYKSSSNSSSSTFSLPKKKLKAIGKLFTKTRGSSSEFKSSSMKQKEKRKTNENLKVDDQRYKESITRLHLERLSISLIFWETTLSTLYSIHVWEQPERTALAGVVYLSLWWYNLLPSAMFLHLAYYLLQYRLSPKSFEPMRRQIRSRILDWMETDSLLGKVRRGTRLDLFALHKTFVSKYGDTAQYLAGEIADINERGENLILWRDPQSSWRCVGFSLCLSLALYYSSVAMIWKSFLLLFGIVFFLWRPLTSHAFEQYQMSFSASWFLSLLTFGAPTHAEYASKLQALA